MRLEQRDRALYGLLLVVVVVDVRLHECDARVLLSTFLYTVNVQVQV